MIFGIVRALVEHTWNTEWTHDDVFHVVNGGIVFLLGGILGLIVEIKEIKQLIGLNVFPSLVLLISGITILAHTQHTEINAYMHQSIGYMFVLTSIAKLLVLLNIHKITKFILALCSLALGMLFCASSAHIIDIVETNMVWSGAGYFGLVMCCAMFILAYVLGLFLLKIKCAKGYNYTQLDTQNVVEMPSAV
jgi:hypothetical protein